MKRYFFFALIAVSASITSISAFATCPMSQGQPAGQVAQGEEPALPEAFTAQKAPDLAAPSGPPASMAGASQPKNPQHLPQ